MARRGSIDDREGIVINYAFIRNPRYPQFIISRRAMLTHDADAAGSSMTPDIDPADLQRVGILKGRRGTPYGASGPVAPH